MRETQARKAAVVGLDGAAWHLIDPLLEAGVMPRLASLKERGASGILTSTVPTYTPPAWTAAATGVNPGRHGIYGFVMGHAQAEHRELAHAGKVKAPTFWEMANAQDATVGVYHLPLTYPPQPLDGWMVSGMMTPGYGERQRGFTQPAEVEDELLSLAPGYVIDVSANWEQDWRDPALCDRVVVSLEQRCKVLEWLLAERPPDILFAVLESPDRLQHVYYRYLDPNDELYSTAEAARLRPDIARCFEAMDRLLGIVEDYVGVEGGVIVCSDHGFTAWEMSVHTNVLLERWGYLKLKRSARLMRTSAARRMVPVAKRFLPAKVARGAKGRTFAAIDWSRTKAFASPIPQQGIYINLEGREPRGIVGRGDLERLKDEIADRFRELKDPDGRQVTDHVYRSQDVFFGDALEGAPDVLPVLRDHRFELDDELFHRNPFSDYRHLPRGAHHPEGIVVVAGDGANAGRPISGSVMDITPTLLYAAGLRVPEGLDGSVMTEAFSEETLRTRPIATTAPPRSEDRDEASPYSAEEEELIEESLRSLGYL